VITRISRNQFNVHVLVRTHPVKTRGRRSLENRKEAKRKKAKKPREAKRSQENKRRSEEAEK
jgi:hypothetical protein